MDLVIDLNIGLHVIDPAKAIAHNPCHAAR